MQFREITRISIGTLQICQCHLMIKDILHHYYYVVFPGEFKLFGQSLEWNWVFPISALGAGTGARVLWVEWICVGFEWICVFPISVLGAGTGGGGGVVGRMDHQIGYHNQPLFILICHFEMSFAFIDL